MVAQSALSTNGLQSTPVQYGRATGDARKSSRSRHTKHALVREKTEARAARLENAGDLVNHNIKIGDVLKNLLMTRSKLPVTKGVRSPSIRK